MIMKSTTQFLETSLPHGSHELNDMEKSNQRVTRCLRNMEADGNYDIIYLIPISSRKLSDFLTNIQGNR